MRLMRGRLLRALTTPLLLAALAACANTNAYAPKSSFSIAADIADFHQQFGTAASLNNYYAHLPETKEGRNEFIAARLTLYNLEYLQFISQFQLTRAQAASAFDITTIGVNLAGSLVGSAATKSILAAIAAGLGQSRTSLEKNFYDTETTSALITAMNAQRKTALVPIVTGMNNDPSQYPLSSAIVDLEAYQQAGTIQGALQAVQADSAVKDAAAQSQIDNVLFTATIQPVALVTQKHAFTSYLMGLDIRTGHNATLDQLYVLVTRGPVPPVDQDTERSQLRVYVSSPAIDASKMASICSNIQPITGKDVCQ
jgi:hypothetical protein